MRFPFRRPQNNNLYDFFTKASSNLDEGATVLALLGGDDPDPASISEQMVRIEHANDELTHNLYNTLNSSFITPFDREDMYRLGSRLDDVIDHMEAAATLVHLYGLKRADNPPEEMYAQIRVLADLGTLTKNSFDIFAAKGDLQPYWVEANRLENEGDRLYRLLLVRLFGGEYDALTVLKFKEVADELERAADAFEQVANTVEAIMVKES